LVLGITLPNLKNIYGSVFAVVLLVGFAVGHRFMVTEALTWPSFIYPAITILVIWMGVTLFRFLVSDKDKRFIKGAFQQYLSPDVIAQLMDNPKQLQLGGEKREMTAFFSDVQGFSTISEQLDPTELVQLLNVYLTRMTDLITDVDGTIDKYEGDAIIAFFGAPMFYEDHAIRACQVTLRMQAALTEMRQTWKEEGVDESLWLYQRIGLNTGDMVVGNMGSAKRFDYTMMGNAVNLAARLEGANKNYGMFNCISEYTYEPAKEAIEVREVDLIRVMGIKTPVRIYELVAEKGQLTEEQTKAFQYFAKGLELYRDQQWDESAKYFNAVNKFLPDDPPSSKYIDRCRDKKANPPPKDWDGVFEATSK
ncbi:MAG: adenylate/guanylate cyclase domain-containing protein, partial [bacterium]